MAVFVARGPAAAVYALVYMYEARWRIEREINLVKVGHYSKSLVNIIGFVTVVRGFESRCNDN